jgi:hypothetical protein
MLNRSRTSHTVRRRGGSWAALLVSGLALAATLSGCYVEPYPYGPGVAVVAPPPPVVVVMPHRCWRCW